MSNDYDINKKGLKSCSCLLHLPMLSVVSQSNKPSETSLTSSRRWACSTLLTVWLANWVKLFFTGRNPSLQMTSQTSVQ